MWLDLSDVVRAVRRGRAVNSLEVHSRRCIHFPHDQININVHVEIAAICMQLHSDRRGGQCEILGHKLILWIITKMVNARVVPLMEFLFYRLVAMWGTYTPCTNWDSWLTQQSCQLEFNYERCWQRSDRNAKKMQAWKIDHLSVGILCFQLSGNTLGTPTLCFFF